MKKLFLMFLAVISISFASCCKKTQAPVANADSDTVAVDSAVEATDTVAADSAM